METWKAIPGYEGIYEASDQGRIRSLPRLTRRGDLLQRRKGKVLKPTADGRGYMRVTLYLDGRPRKRLVHRLVLFAFVGAPADGQEACHGRGGPSDNRLANLRWDTRAENNYDRVRHGGRKKKCKNGHPLSGDNLYVYVGPAVPNGMRVCRTCGRERNRLSRQKRQNRMEKAS